MFLFLAVVCGADPTYEVVNRCPPALTVSNKCPVSAKAGYPVRGNWWTGCPNWQHLTTGVHAGSFPVEWLKTLTNAEVQSLHSDQHEGKVRWEYVPSSTKVPSKTPVNTPIYTPKYTGYSTAYCPPGASH